MRINKFIAAHSGLSRRTADQEVSRGKVTVNGTTAITGMDVSESDEVRINGKILDTETSYKTILLNKPAGYVVSRNGQGAPVVYDLLPAKFQHLNAVGRLDKDSSGLLVFTNNGGLAQMLTHPSKNKTKIYEVSLNKNLGTVSKKLIESGIELEDGKSKLKLNGSNQNWTVSMHEGRNRQIRRTFQAAGYKVTKLHRVKFGDYVLPKDLKFGKLIEIEL